MIKKLHMIGLILLLGVSLVLITGCGWVDNLHFFKNGEENAEDTPETEEDTTASILEQGLDVPEPEDGEEGNSDAENGDTDTAMTGETMEIVLYFASANGESLEAETRKIPKQEAVARASVNQLISGPAEDGLYPTLPAATILEDINIRDGICTVDFSSDLLEDISTSTQSQLLAVYSIVNTLTQFDSVEYVQILVDGQTISGGIGGIDLSEAIAPVDF